MSRDDINDKFDNLTNKVEGLEEENRQLKAEMQNTRRYGRRYKPFYEYKSPDTYMGLPLIHITQGINPKTGKANIAKGIIAIGDVAIGVVSIGGVSFGVLSIGGVSVGVLGALGGFSLCGCLAVGAAAIGGIAIGAIAIGYYAMGALAIGIYASGATTYGSHMNFLDWINELVKIKF